MRNPFRCLLSNPRFALFAFALLSIVGLAAPTVHHVWERRHLSSLGFEVYERWQVTNSGLIDLSRKSPRSEIWRYFPWADADFDVAWIHAEDSRITSGALETTSHLQLRGFSATSCSFGPGVISDLLGGHEIETLSLGNCLISNDEARIILSCPTLKQVELDGCPIDDSSIDLTTLSRTVSYLNIRGTAISLEKAMAIAEARPDIRLESSYSHRY